MRRATEIAAGLALAVASVAAVLLLLEIGLRLAASFGPGGFDALMDQPRVRQGETLHLLDLIRRHPDDGVVYELRPGTRGRFLDQELQINSLGMRDVERSRRKPAGSFRILVLGDSETFGWGVTRDEAFPALVEERLSVRAGGPRVEVLNAGVPGYNAMQEVRRFELLADEIDPDLVLIHYVDNDMDLPNFLTVAPDIWSPESSFLAELVRKRLALLRGSRVFPGRMRGVPLDPQDRYRLPEQRIPERFRPLQGWDRLIDAYRSLARLSRQRGIPYAVSFHWNDYRLRLEGELDDVLPAHVRGLAGLCERLGYLVVDPQERVLRHLREHGLSHRALWYKTDDRHPSALSHRLLAEEIAARLESAGLLDAAQPPGPHS